jgi:hypothetical protein
VPGIECEGVDDEERVRIRPVIDTDADDVASLEITEQVLAEIADHCRIDREKETVVGRNIRTADPWAEAFFQHI